MAPRFRDELANTSSLQDFRLLNHSPLAFRLFLDFCQKPVDPVTYRPLQYSPEPWSSAAAVAWVLAVELRARRFEKYALSHFIQNCAIAVQGPWAYVESRTDEDSSLRRFSDHWVAWNVWLSNGNADEYNDLQAVALATLVKPSTRDPRIYDIDHWYQLCGANVNATCEHDPMQRQRQRERQARAERPPPDQWGRKEELKAQARR